MLGSTLNDPGGVAAGVVDGAENAGATLLEGVLLTLEFGVGANLIGFAFASKSPEGAPKAGAGFACVGWFCAIAPAKGLAKGFPLELPFEAPVEGWLGG